MVVWILQHGGFLESGSRNGQELHERQLSDAQMVSNLQASMGAMLQDLRSTYYCQTLPCN